MRDIKFRGLKIDGDVWVYGSLTLCGTAIIHYHVWDADHSHVSFRKAEVKPKTVGQYTGLKDSNGIEIYEGDITRCTIPRAGYDDATETRVDFIKGAFTGCNIFEGYNNIIVGNIHEQETK